MPKWQTSPNTTPVKRFIRGHFYHIDFEHKPVTFLGRFKWKGISPSGVKDTYWFDRIADSQIYLPPFGKPSPYFMVFKRSLSKIRVYEVSLKDLPLYVGYTLCPQFEQLIQDRSVKRKLKLSRKSKQYKLVSF